MAPPNNNNNPNLLAMLQRIGQPEQLQSLQGMPEPEPQNLAPQPQPATTAAPPTLPAGTLQKLMSRHVQRGPPVEVNQKAMDEMFYKNIQEQKGHTDNLQGQFDKLKAQPETFADSNLKPLMALADQLGGTNNIAASYTAPTGIKDRRDQMMKLQEDIAKQQGGLRDDQLAYLKNAIADKKNDAWMAKLGGVGNDDKDAKWLSEDLDPNKARAGNLAKSQAMVNSADRVDALFRQFPDYNIPKAQTMELATSIAALVSGGTPQSQHQIDALVANSGVGSLQDFASWITNNPHGRQQIEAMKLMHDTALRERGVAQDQVKSAQIQRLAAHSGFASRNPQSYQSILNSYGIDQSQIKDGRYAKQPENHNAITDEDKQMIAWAKLPANANDPTAQGILKSHGL